MSDAADPDASLEARVISAHRAYLEALTALERLRHATGCPACSATGLIGTDPHALSRSEERKEACRLVLRDLLNEIGYVPAQLEARLSAAHESTCPARSKLH